jgi:signal transduction histidine kinase
LGAAPIDIPSSQAFFTATRNTDVANAATERDLASHGGLLSKTDFLRGAEARIEQEMFLRRFGNWRVSLASMIAMAWLVGAMYRYNYPAGATLQWAMLVSSVFACIALLCLGYERWRPADLGSRAQQRWLHAWIVASAIAAAVTGLLPWFLPAELIEAQFSSAALVSIPMIAFVVSRANRTLVRTAVIAYALSLSLSLVLHAREPWAVPVCLAFSAILLGLGLMVNNALRQAIGDQMYAGYLHGEVRRSHARQLAVQQREVALNERQRMMSDLHDGFGAQLIGSLRQLEGGQLGVDGAIAALRECIDDLRLTVDAHEPSARNLATLLGMLRHRMQPRLRAPGLLLHWRVDELPEGAALSAPQSLDLLRILQQGIANVLQHAEARELSIVARRLPRQLEIAVEDDGKGLDPMALQRGRGIASMQKRAARLGAELLLEGRAEGGTALRLRLRWPPGVVA